MNIVIIGNGITGITCARNIRKLNSRADITIISGESDHFYARTALMYIYMGHMKYEHTKPFEDWFWKKNRIQLLNAWVTGIDTTSKTILFQQNPVISYDILIIASGSLPNKLGWPGENLKGVQGLYSLQDLQSMERDTSGISNAVIIGGGLIGIEMAEMIRSRNIPVTFLVREDRYWGNILPPEESQLLERHIKEHGIQIMLNTELEELIGDENGRVKSIRTKTGENISCQFAGLTAGVSPNIKFLQESSIETDKGILVNEYFETSIADIYAAGDCAQFRQPKAGHPAIEQLWYTGKMHGEALAKTLCGNKTIYNRGIWFNSAKFLDIEYQTYGHISPKLPEDQESFYWEHPQGKIAFRANYTKADKVLVGFNFLGIRFRQTIAEDWIGKKRTIDHAITHLKEGWFDPEFSKQYYKEIAISFSRR